MEISIIKEENNKLVGREEITAILKPQTSYDDAKKIISEKLKKPQELIVIKRMNPVFGKKEVKIEIYIYSSEESMKKFEPKPNVKKEAEAK